MHSNVLYYNSQESYLARGQDCLLVRDEEGREHVDLLIDCFSSALFPCESLVVVNRFGRLQVIKRTRSFFFSLTERWNFQGVLIIGLAGLRVFDRLWDVRSVIDCRDGVIGVIISQIIINTLP